MNIEPLNQIKRGPSIQILVLTFVLRYRIPPYMLHINFYNCRYLTVTQMLQFFFAMVMTLNAIRIGCDFPMWMQWALVAYMVSFLVLFGK